MDQERDGTGGPSPSDGEIMGGFLKGLSVIEAFDRDHDALTIAEVAKATGLDRATARRCLKTLTRVGFAETDGRKFRLTARVLRLGYSYLSAAPIPRFVQPLLERVSEAIGESSSASVLDGDEIVYVARASPRRVLAVGLNVGSRLPAFCSSMGRVMLAARPPEEARALLEASARPALTASTVTQVEPLMAVLERVRAQDYALVDQELEVGLRSLAVPLRNVRGDVAGAINVGLHAARMSCEDMVALILPRLRAVQQEAARSLP